MLEWLRTPYPPSTFRALLTPGVRKLVREHGLPLDAVDLILNDPAVIAAIVDRNDYTSVTKHPVFYWWPLSEAWFARQEN